MKTAYRILVCGLLAVNLFLLLTAMTGPVSSPMPILPAAIAEAEPNVVDVNDTIAELDELQWQQQAQHSMAEQALHMSKAKK